MKKLPPVREPSRWALAAVMITVVAFGWRIPVLGYVVPLAMVAGIGGAFFRGRWVCGNLCPRGSFYDTLFRYIGGSRPLPQFLRKPGFRWTLATGLMTMIGVQIAANPSDPLHWGYVFWLACAVTTGAGVILGLTYTSRAWCMVCPVGTMAAAIGGLRKPLEVGETCVGCRRCETVCPMHLSVAAGKGGLLQEPDCIRCSSCVESCHLSALSWPEGEKTTEPDTPSLSPN